MKNAYKNTFAYVLSGIIISSSILPGCTVTNKIFVEEDIVYSSKRIELKYLVKDRDRRSPLHYMQQTVIKEINANKEVSYTAFDVLTLSGSSFRLDDKVFLIIDNEAFPMKINKTEYENVKNISEDTSEILSADSTKVSVITGYSENERKIARFSYNIPGEIISKIKVSNQFVLRYYSGPSMVTIRPTYKSRQKLKEMIDIN
jgi:hypothetical protein